MRQNVQGDNYSEAVVVIPPLYSVFDDTANDSDKSWTVPANEIWKLNFVHVDLTTTATAGNRILMLEVQDANGDVILDLFTGAVQAASLSRSYNFMQGTYRETSFVNTEIQLPMPQDLYLEPGWVLRVYDSAAVAAAADDMTVSFQAMRYQV